MMTTEQFLTQIVFRDLDYTTTEEQVFIFKPEAFKEVIERCTANGIGIYKILLWKDDEVNEIVSHNQFLKKATDLRWAKSAFFKYHREDETFQFSGDFKVSDKLLQRAALFVPKEKVKDEEE